MVSPGWLVNDERTLAIAAEIKGMVNFIEADIVETPFCRR